MNKNKIKFLIIPISILFLLIGCSDNNMDDSKIMDDTQVMDDSQVMDSTITTNDMDELDVINTNEKVTDSDSGIISINEDKSAINVDKKDINIALQEFNIDSFVENDNGKMNPQFSLKNIEVKKGDKVKININTTSGTHNFKIDEFNIFTETPTGEVTTIEFTADKVGDFIYYCAKPGHREKGQWGTITVTE